MSSGDVNAAADTIRRTLRTAATLYEREQALAALDAYEAERQQAIDDSAEWKEAFEAAVVQRKQAIDALRKIEPQQQRILEWFRSEGIIFDTAPGGDPKSWQQVAFTIYTALCEVDSIARAALHRLGEISDICEQEETDYDQACDRIGGIARAALTAKEGTGAGKTDQPAEAGEAPRPDNDITVMPGHEDEVI